MKDSLWSRLERKLQHELDAEEFATWFRPLIPMDEGAGELVLGVPTERFLYTLEESYRDVLDRLSGELGERGLSIRFEVTGSADGTTEDERPDPRALAQFNPRYRFETFVVGSSNQFAHAAAMAVAASPAHSYNPLFLYGGVGLGKTHLMHAIGHRILDRQPDLKVLYLTAEQFVNDLIHSIRFDRMPAFRERYRTIDVLLVDDVQFLANKERTQEEFFHTFNTLYTSQKQIILSSDSSPREIPTLEERLRSRFEWGLISDIQPPDLETKVVILRRKAETESIDLPREVAEFIARQVKSNIRELEGMLTRVTAFALMTGKPLTMDMARETLQKILPEQGRRLDPKDIVKHVAHRYGLKVGEIKSKSNSRQIVFPRQVAMYVVKKLTDLSYPEIGKLFNNKHHSTVMHSVEKITQLRQEDADLDRALREIEEQFG
jgi:chromosomal replication initiator protein